MGLRFENVQSNGGKKSLPNYLFKINKLKPIRLMKRCFLRKYDVLSILYNRISGINIIFYS